MHEPQESWYYLNASNEAVGPIPIEELHRLFKTRSIQRGTLVVQAGDEKWEPYERAIILRNLLTPRGIFFGCLGIVGALVVFIVGAYMLGLFLSRVSPAFAPAPDPTDPSLTTSALRTYLQNTADSEDRKIAASNNGEAQNSVADQKSREGNRDEALLWSRLAADDGSWEAQSYIGSFFSEHDQFALGQKYLIAAAKSGCLDAMNNLGFIYSGGTGLAPDKVEALKWFLIYEMSGGKAAVIHIKELNEDLSPSEIAKAEAEAQAWIDANPISVSVRSSCRSLTVSCSRPARFRRYQNILLLENGTPRR